MSAFILFNGLKHHRQVIQQFVQNYNAGELHTLLHTLIGIGNSQMDLYQGRLSESEIFEEIHTQLIGLDALAEEAYRYFLLPHHYQTLELSDTSRWVLRLGERDEQHIHIHPGRYSPHTLRVKATTLKTAIAALIWQKEEPQPLTTETLNVIRQDILRLSPVRTLDESQSIARMMQVLADRG